MPKFHKNIDKKYWVTGNQEIEVGDSKDNKCHPQMKFLRWGNDANFSLRLDSDSLGNNFKNVKWDITENDTLIVMTYDFIQLKFYKTQDDRFEYESPEFETVLLNKPTNYVSGEYKLYYTIRSKNLTFHKQPEITQEEIDEGCGRPDWCVGSYAIYHSTKKHNQYKTGKALHISKPEMIDSQGIKRWNDIEINNGLMTVTTDLSTVSYPCYHVSGATFGYTTVGGSTNALGSFNYSNQATLSEAGTVSTISVYVNPNTANDDIKAALWLYSDDSLAASGDELTNVGDVTEWKTVTGFSASLTATDYWIGASTSSAIMDIYYDTLTDHPRAFTSTKDYAGFPPASMSGYGTSTGRIYSIYATYTASGGATFAKINGFSLASIDKVSGISLTSIDKILGIDKA